MNEAVEKFLRKFMDEPEPKEMPIPNGFNEFIYPLQHLMNTVHEIVEAKGWDVEEWNMKDLDKFAEAASKFGK